MNKLATLAVLDIKIQEIRERSRLKINELAERFVGEARKVGCEILEANDMAGAGRLVVDIAKRKNASLVQTSSELLLDELNLVDTVNSNEIRVDGPVPEPLLSANLGVSDAVFAVAETGSAMIHLDDVDSRLTTMLPPVHIVVLRRESIVESLEDGLTITRHRILALQIQGKASLHYLGHRPEPNSGHRACSDHWRPRTKGTLHYSGRVLRPYCVNSK